MDAFERMARAMLGDGSAMSADMFEPLRGDEDEERGFQGEPTRSVLFHVAATKAGASPEQIDRIVGLVADTDLAVQLSRDLVFHRIRKDRKGDQDLQNHETLFLQSYLADVWGCTGQQLNPSAVPSAEQDASVKPKQEEPVEPPKKTGSTVVRAAPPPGGKRPEPSSDEDEDDEEGADDGSEETPPSASADGYEDRSAPTMTRHAARKGGYRIEVDKDSTVRPPPKDDPPARTADPEDDEPEVDRRDRKGKGKDRRETNPELRALQDELKKHELRKKLERLRDEEAPPARPTPQVYTPAFARGVLVDPRWLRLRDILEGHFEKVRSSDPAVRAAGEAQISYWLGKLSSAAGTRDFGPYCQNGRLLVRDLRAGLDQHDQRAYVRRYYDPDWEPPSAALAP